MSLILIFITIVASIWFVFMTVLGNYGVYKFARLHPNLNVKIQSWTIILDILATAWLIAMIIKLF